MRHQKRTVKLNRTSAHRRALLRNLSAALIVNGRIRTTEAKAKALRPYVEKLVTLAKGGTQAEHRRAYATLGNKKAATNKLFSEIGPRMADRPGGYTRIIRDSRRAGDGAEMAYIEFVDFVPEIEAKVETAEEEETPAQ